MACADVVDGYAFLLYDGFESRYVSSGEIYYVDIVAYTGAVMGVIVIAENSEFGAFAYGCLCDVWHEVVGDSIGILSDGA